MSNDLPLTLTQVCSRLPGARGAKRVSPSTVTRWILAGCPARNGTRVRLAATRCGSRWLVHQRDLDAFFTTLAAEPAEPTDPAPSPPGRTPAQRQRAGEVAARELDQLGV
jgi:hypothetical protein